MVYSLRQRFRNSDCKLVELEDKEDFCKNISGDNFGLKQKKNVGLESDSYTHGVRTIFILTDRLAQGPESPEHS